MPSGENNFAGRGLITAAGVAKGRVFKFTAVLLGSWVAAAAAKAVPSFTWAAGGGGISNCQAYAVAEDTNGNVLLTGFFTGTMSIGSSNLISSGAEDVFVAKYDAGGNFRWVRQAGGSGYDEGRGIAADPAGNIYVTGLFQATASFGATNLTSSGQSDVFIAKYDPNGSLLWARGAGGTDFDESHAIAVDRQGNAYITGYIDANATFGSISLVNHNGSDNIFVAKCSSTGTFLWARQAGGSLSDIGNGIALDAATNVYVTGYFSGSATFGTNMLTSVGSSNLPDIFLAKYDMAGNLSWVKQAGGSGDDEATAVAADAKGNVWITGKFASSATFGATNLSGTGTQIFLARCDSAGNFVWAARAGGANLIYGNCGLGVATDSNTNAIVAGYYSGKASFGNTNVPIAGFDDIFGAKYDALGNVSWARAAGGIDLDISYGVAADAAGNPCLAGFYASPTVNFDNTTLTNTGARDIFVAKLAAPVLVLPPWLAIVITNGSVQLSWPSAATSAGYVLETAPQVSGATWSNMGSNFGLSGTSSIVTMPLSPTQAFFRLHKP